MIFIMCSRTDKLIDRFDFCFASIQLCTFNYSSDKKKELFKSHEKSRLFLKQLVHVKNFYFGLTTLVVVDGRMLYRPLLLSLLHSSFTAKHLTMNYLPMYRSDGVYSLFFASLSISSVRFCSLVHRSDGYLRGKGRE
jgi:hypothetical protein